MRFVTPEVHAIMDYAMSLLLITSPYILGFSHERTAAMLPMILGLLALIITILTDFKLAIVRIIPLKWHLVYDFFGGAFLLLSPWIFDFSNQVFMPHVVFGALQILASLTTSTSRKDNLEALEKIV
jgi:hypothetical protein